MLAARHTWCIRAVAISALLMLTLAAGCGNRDQPFPPFFNSATPTPTPLIFPTPRAGWKAHPNAAFQINLPESWDEVPLDPTALRNAIADAQNTNPHLADMLRVLLESGQAQNLAFYAIDTHSANVITNVTIARSTFPGGTNFEQFAQAYANALPQQLKGAKVIETPAPQIINGMPTAEVDYDVPLVNASGNLITLRGAQSIFLTNSGTTFVVTLTGDAKEADALVALARQIAQTFVAVGP